MELIDYAEQQGLANYHWQQRVNETTRHEANITLGFLLAGGSASLAWAVSTLAGGATALELPAASIATAVWLFALAAAIQFQCLAFKPAMPPANHPLHLYKPQFDTTGIREINLDYLEQAIIHAISNGQKRAKALTILRYAACLTPLVFLAAWSLAAWYCG